MSSQVILYDWLSIQKTGDIDKSKLALDLSGLPPVHAEMIQVLILEYNTRKGSHELIPFDGNRFTQNTGIRYGNIHDLPEPLLRILYNYIQEVRKAST
jgi:hypothetical protein